MSAYVWHGKESRKSRHDRRKIERQQEEEERSKLVESVGVGLELPPFELQVGDHEQRLEVPPGCAGLIIGKKGENLKGVEQRFKVKVSLDKANKLVVSGPNQRDVAAAAKELDFAADELEIDPLMAGWACGKGGRHLRMLRDLVGVAVLSLKSEGGDESPEAADEAAADGDAEAGATEQRPRATRRPPDRAWFDIRGRRDQVANTRTCLEAHLSYHPVFEEMDEAEKEIDAQITELQAKLGPRRSGGGKGGGRGAGGRGDGGGGRRRAGPPVPAEAPQNGANRDGAKGSGAQGEAARGRGRGRKGDGRGRG